MAGFVHILPKIGLNSSIFYSACFIECTLEKKLGRFNPNLGQIWTNPNVGLKM